MMRLVCFVAVAVACIMFRARQVAAADPVAATGPATRDGGAGGQDWPQWRGPNRNGISAEKITWPAAGPKQLWKAAVGEGYSSVSVSGGRAYTMGSSKVDGINEEDTVWCLDAKTGAVVWKYSYVCHQGGSPNYPGPRATPTVEGQFVYTVSYKGQLHALNAATGAMVWSVDYVKDLHGRITNSNRHGISGSPLVDGDLLLAPVGGKGASVVAFDKATGKVVWKSGDDPPSFSSPVSFTVGDQRLVAILSGTGLFAYKLADGKPLWNVPWKNAEDLNTPEPILLGDKVFVTCGSGGKGSPGSGCGLFKITNDGLQEVYHNSNLSSQFACPVLIDGCIYGFDGYVSRKGMVCLDVNTGEIKWKNEKLSGSLIAAGNKLIIQAMTGHLVVAEASPEGYKEIGRAPVFTRADQCWTPPALANGCVYCRNTKGDVVCLDLSGK